MTPSRRVRDALLDGCRERGVTPTFHYVPLHSSDAGRRFSDRDHDCPVTNDVSDRLLRLPFYTAMTDAEVRTVVDTVVRVIESLATD